MGRTGSFIGPSKGRSGILGSWRFKVLPAWSSVTGLEGVPPSRPARSAGWIDTGCDFERGIVLS